ncbi:MAG: DUF3098 domain-containing protein [Bacteroidaceae bacterium]|nr:DUF3098 domain-containing protein [Bacteroidaceae bacterium]
MDMSNFAFKKTNYVLLAIGMAIIIWGFILMSGSGTEEGFFNPEIFSARRIRVAPLVSLAGFIFVMYAIMYNPNKKKQDEQE